MLKCGADPNAAATPSAHNTQTPLALALGLASPMPIMVALLLEFGATDGVVSELVPSSLCDLAIDPNILADGVATRRSVAENVLRWHKHARIAALLAAYNLLEVETGVVDDPRLFRLPFVPHAQFHGGIHCGAVRSIHIAVAYAAEWGPLRFAVAAGVSARGIRTIMARDLDNFDTYRHETLVSTALTARNAEPPWSQMITQDEFDYWDAGDNTTGSVPASQPPPSGPILDKALVFGVTSPEVLSYLKAGSRGTWNAKTHWLRGENDRAAIHLLLLVAERLRRLSFSADEEEEEDISQTAPEVVAVPRDGDTGRGAAINRAAAAGNDDSSTSTNNNTSGALPVLPPELWMCVILPLICRTPLRTCLQCGAENVYRSRDERCLPCRRSRIAADDPCLGEGLRWWEVS